MAQAPNSEEVKAAIRETNKKIVDKRSKQKAQDKSFDVEDHGPGVIPEAVWKGLKS